MGFHVRAREEEEGKHGHRVEAHRNPGKEQVLRQVHETSQRVEKSAEEDDGGYDQVDVSKWVLELSAGLCVRVPHLDKDANSHEERRGGQRRKETQQTWGELTGSILATWLNPSIHFSIILRIVCLTFTHDFDHSQDNPATHRY